MGTFGACSPTITCICGPTRSARPSEYFTQENVDRYLAAAEEQGIDELGVSEHIYRFTEALEIWHHPYWQDQARDDLGAYCEFVSDDAAAARGRGATSSAAAEDRIASLLEATTSTTWSAPSTSSARRARSTTSATTSGSRSATPTRSGAPTSSGRPSWSRSGLFDIVSHPDLVKIWGTAGPHRSGTRASTTSRFVEAIGRVRDRGRGVDRRAAQAGGRDLPGARVRRDVRRGGRRVRALLGRPRPRPGGVRL